MQTNKMHKKYIFSLQRVFFPSETTWYLYDDHNNRVFIVNIIIHNHNKSLVEKKSNYQ